MPVRDPIRVLMPDGSVRVMALEEYLRAVVPAEMPALWPTEAVKAQAVASRSYARAAMLAPRHAPVADVCTDTHCQVYNEARIHAASDAAIEATAGETLWYAGQLAVAFFSAACGGRTRGNDEVWGGERLPYLQPVDCPCGKPKSGHGVGLCQWGAKAQADQGLDYRAILKHYYTGVRLSSEADPVPPPESPRDTGEQDDALRQAVIEYVTAARAALDRLAAAL